MSEHSYSRLWIHMIFHTKDLQPLITPAAEPDIHAHLAAQLSELECPAIVINGTQDHVHLLFRLHPMRTVTDVAKQIKGHTSHTINRYKITRRRFSWEKGFLSLSVSDAQIEEVKDSILRQKTFHENISCLEEMDTLIAEQKHSLADLNGLLLHASELSRKTSETYM